MSDLFVGGDQKTHRRRKALATQPRDLEHRLEPEAEGFGRIFLTEKRNTGDRKKMLDRNVLGFGVLVDSFDSVATAQARVLDPAHGGIHRSPCRCIRFVDVYCASVETLSDR